MPVPYLKLVIEFFEAQDPWERGAILGMTSYLGLHKSYNQAENQANSQA